MIPKSVSASSLDVAEKCMAMYRASHLDRGAGLGNPAAQLGTTLHAALEKFVDPSMIKAGVWDWDLLELCYVQAYHEIFGPDKTTAIFADGLAILKKWYGRSDQQLDLMEVEIVSREVKKDFAVPFVHEGTKYQLPCNYIIDRLDRIDETTWRVVDYKSQRSPFSPEEMRLKIQPKIYALAVQIEHPEATKIWVQFDFLRYERVGILFTREDNADTWHWLKGAVQRIVDTPTNEPPETLNESCRYCIRKFRCSTLQSNLRVGGIFSLSPEELADQYYKLRSQADALKQMQDEIELQLLQYANENDMLTWETETARIKVTSAKRRKVDRDKMAAILGPKLMKKYGRLNLGDLDELRKDPDLTIEQASLLDTAISYEYSDPGIKITPKVKP
jgi:hypothetical protein